MKIAGLQKLTLLDFPGKVSCTVFTFGCNFRCPFCHNASLVVGEKEPDAIPEEEFFSFLKKRQGILDGVAITGGEPLLAVGIEDFIRRVRSLGFAVKLDTNGSFPEKLKGILDNKLVDYVAMDVKSSFAGYARVAGTAVDTAKIERSISLLKESGIPHEFRTTLVKGLHEPKDIAAIAAWLGAEEPYFLQSFRDSGDILGEGCESFSKKELEEFLAAAGTYIPGASLRGVD